jgi:hypothetical protein
MGYTSYWNFKNVSSDQFRKGFDDARETLADILERYKNIIRYECDSEEPAQLGVDFIRFNGIEDEGHETFFVSYENRSFAFCKTARKPYDLPVCECLLVLKYYIPQMHLDSDGFYLRDGKLDGCWHEAIDNVKKLYDIATDIHISDDGRSVEKIICYE